MISDIMGILGFILSVLSIFGVKISIKYYNLKKRIKLKVDEKSKNGHIEYLIQITTKNKKFFGQTRHGKYKDKHNKYEIWFDISKRLNKSSSELRKSREYIDMDEFNDGVFKYSFIEEPKYEISVVVGVTDRNGKDYVTCSKLMKHYR